jgi:hypothetical protein
MLESSPTLSWKGTNPEKIMNLRARQVEKEIHGEIRHKPKNTADRVFESILMNHPNSLNWKPTH